MEVFVTIIIIALVVGLIIYGLTRLDGNERNVSAAAGCASGAGCGYVLVYVVLSILSLIGIIYLIIWLFELIFG